MRIPLLNLNRQYADLQPTLTTGFEKFMQSGAFILGPDVEAFEREIADFLNIKHAIAVTSGTDALWLALKALGVGAGDQVLTSPFTFFATISSIVNVGASPCFADILEGSFNLDPSKVEEVLKKDVKRRIKAIVPVHLYGQAADMDAFLKISEKYGVPVVEDAAQAIHAQYKGKSAGGMGSLGTFSFYPSKNLGAMGDAGMVTTQDDTLAEKVATLRKHGCGKKNYYHDVIGSNCRMDTVQAMILRTFLPHLKSWIGDRQKTALRYDEAFSKVGTQLVAPPRSEFATHTYHQYTLRVKNGKRDAFQAHLNQKEIASCVYYPIPCHLQEALADLRFKQGDFPLSENAALEAISIPIFPKMTEAERDYVVSSVVEFFK